MEITGKITKKLAPQKGVSARGEWQKQEFVIEYQEGQYPSVVCFNVWGADKVNELAGYSEGEEVKVSFNLSAREYAGRWYNDLRAWRIERVNTQQYSTSGMGANTMGNSANASRPDAANTIPAPTIDDLSEPEEDDLPF